MTTRMISFEELKKSPMILDFVTKVLVLDILNRRGDCLITGQPPFTAGREIYNALLIQQVNTLLHY